MDKNFLSRYSLTAVATAGFLSASIPVLGAADKLNGTLPVGGNVSSHLISPDGTKVIYRADQTSDGVFELFSVPIEGGEPTRLNSVLPAGGDVSSQFYISPDSSRVVYKADQEQDNAMELYSVPTGGGVPQKLNNALSAGGAVKLVKISPDSTSVAFTAETSSANPELLFTSPTDGGGASTLVSPDPNLVGVPSVFFSPSSDDLFYVQEYVGSQRALFHNAVSGGSKTLLALSLSGGASYKPTPDGSQVVYVSTEDTSGVDEIFITPASSRSPLKLNPALAPGGDVDPFEFEVSPDGNRVLYIANIDSATLDELYSVATNGTGSFKVNASTASGSRRVESFRISPDSARVVYVSAEVQVNVDEVYSRPITGGAVKKLNSPLVATGSVVASSIAISPDSQRVVYRADGETAGTTELYSVPITGGDVIKLNGALVAGGDVLSYEITPLLRAPSAFVFLRE